MQNRVKEIRANLPVAEWKYCPGENNPADIPSRGNYLSHADVQKKWLQGPEFLLHSHGFWPKLPDASNVVNDESIDNDNPMAGEVISVHSVTNKASGVNDVISISSFNSFKKLVLVTSYVFRFIYNMKALIRKEQLKNGKITLAEKSSFRIMWLLNEQKSIDEAKFKQLKISLGAYEDIDGLFKLKGRLDSDLSECAKFPVFIPKESSLNKLLILDAHTKVLHSGRKDTLSEVRSEYWLVQGRSKAKTFLNKCNLCKKFSAKLLQKPPAAPLSDFRAQCCDPFTHTGVDYLGPLYVYSTPSSKTSTLGKVHVALFTCANTRAVHLDIVHDVSCEAFGNCLRRFISRRGIPKLFISDNAKCFVGTELKKFAEMYDIEWRYIMEVSPWWGAGGFYERMVQIGKRPMRKILRRTNVTYDELLTIVNEIEAVVNCRPLCYLYSDDIEQVLTPSHLITGKRLISVNRVLPDDNFQENENNLNSRLKHLRTLIGHYEKRWKQEYLTEFREYQRNHDKLPAKQLKVGDIVLINDEKLPRNRWRLGKVEELIKSKDGYVRACKLRVHSENRT